MQDLFASGRAADIVLALMAVEAIVLAMIYRRTGRGLRPREIATNLFSGACLVLALRAALVGAGWTWVAAGLLGSLAGHALDLITRARALCDPMESDRRSSLLFCRIFFDEPVSTSSENALVLRAALHCV